MEKVDTKRLLEIVGYALEKSEGELDSYLDSVCGENSLLRREVLDYLEYDSKASVFLPASGDATAPNIPDAEALETRYDLGEEIARGGMGVIFRAYDRNLRRDVAVKVLSEGRDDDPETLCRFIQEAQIGGQLQHPGIAPTYDLGRLPDRRPFIAMKLVKGKTLASLLAERTDAADAQTRLLSIFQQICQAIAFAHTSGVIHRDLKPANVMVGEFGEVQVMDWGLAKIITDGEPEDTPSEKANELVIPDSDFQVDSDSGAYRTRVGQVMGTPAYMPPEQPLGLWNKRTDVFSLGAILCEILTGEPTACDMEAAVERLNRSETDPELIQLARDCIERSPADRPKDAGVVARRISAHLNAIQSRLQDAEVATARAEVRAEHERKLRHRTLWTIAVVATLLLIAAISTWVIRNSIGEQQRQDRAQALVNQLLTADSAQVPAILEQFAPYRKWANPLLKTELAAAADGSVEKLHLAVALLPDEGQVRYLRGQLPSCALEQFPLAREALHPHEDKVTDGLWQLVLDQQQAAAERFQAAAALARYSPDDERWEEVAPFVAQHLASVVASVYVNDWLRLFEPASKHLIDPLADIHADRSGGKETRERTAVALAGYLRHKPLKLSEIILLADERAEFSALIEKLVPYSASVRLQLVAEMQSPMPDNLSVEQRDAHWKRQSIAAVTLVHLGHGEDVWQLLQLTPKPSLRSFIIRHLGKLNADHNTLAARLEAETNVSIRRALIQSLGGLDVSRIPPSDRNRIAEQLKALYVNDFDPGVHSAASWTLRQWGLTLPESPIGEPVFSEEKEQEVARLDAQVEEIQRIITAYEREELPVRQVAWEQEIREQPVEVPASLSEGLVAHYPLDETEGSTTANLVDREANGKYQGPGKAQWVPAIVGGGLRLEGKGDYIDCGQAFQPKRTDAFSLVCWFFADRESSRGVLFGKYSEQLRRGFAVNIDPGSNAVICEWSHLFPLSALIVKGKSTELVGRWHHIVVTYDGSSSANGVRIFLDGQSLRTWVLFEQLSDTIQTSLPLQIGRRDVQYFFRGMIDDVRFYDRVLDNKEVVQLYKCGVRALVETAAEDRTPEHETLLAAFYRPLDDPLQLLEDQLVATETARRDARWSSVRRWYVNSQGQTMAVLHMRLDNRVDHSFAISTQEVTAAEYRRFRENDSGPAEASDFTDRRPASHVSWYRAAEYCNWLSQQDGIPEEQWVYEPNADGNYQDGMRIKDDFLDLRGYRLPTSGEWVHACRAGTTGTFSFGESVELMTSYGRHDANSSGRSQPVASLLPNDAGLFDMHGNLLEWSITSSTSSLLSIRDMVGLVAHGSAYSHPAEQLRSNSAIVMQPLQMSFPVGCRPVRTYRLPSP